MDEVVPDQRKVPFTRAGVKASPTKHQHVHKEADPESEVFHLAPLLVQSEKRALGLRGPPALVQASSPPPQ